MMHLVGSCCAFPLSPFNKTPYKAKSRVVRDIMVSIVNNPPVKFLYIHQPIVYGTGSEGITLRVSLKTSMPAYIDCLIG